MIRLPGDWQTRLRSRLALEFKRSVDSHSHKSKIYLISGKAESKWSFAMFSSVHGSRIPEELGGGIVPLRMCGFRILSTLCTRVELFFIVGTRLASTQLCFYVYPGFYSFLNINVWRYNFLAKHKAGIKMLILIN